MKVNKVLIIIQLAIMYISEILLALAAFPNVFNLQELENASGALFIAAIVTSLVAVLFAFAILVPSIISIFKKNNEDMTLFTMIIKLAAIPWYIINFILCGFMLAGALNPFMFFAIPFMIAIFECVTYIDMFAVSFNNVAVLISELRTKTIKPSALLIVGMVFHFIFCLDVLGAIFTYVNYRKINNKEIQ